MIQRRLIALLLAGAFSVFGQDGGSTDERPSVPLPDETAGYDKIIPALIASFDHADIVALGEYHGRKMDSDLRIQLVRHPDFAKKVHFIVVEFGNTGSQQTLDHYMQGEDVPLAELQQVWKNTTQTSGVWNSPVYAEFYAAVREVNRKLPAAERIRVLAGDPPPDGPRMKTVVSVLEEQVLDKGGKALLIYGNSHIHRAGSGVGGITKSLQPKYRSRIFVVDVLGGITTEYQKFEDALKSTVRPVLVSLRRAPFRDFSADEFLGQTLKVFTDGAWVPAPAYQGLTLGQVADACIYLGMSPDVETRINPVR